MLICCETAHLMHGHLWGDAELSLTGLQRGRCLVRAVVLFFGIGNVL